MEVEYGENIEEKVRVVAEAVANDFWERGYRVTILSDENNDLYDVDGVEVIARTRERDKFYRFKYRRGSTKGIVILEYVVPGSFINDAFERILSENDVNVDIRVVDTKRGVRGVIRASKEVNPLDYGSVSNGFSELDRIMDKFHEISKKVWRLPDEVRFASLVVYEVLGKSTEELVGLPVELLTKPPFATIMITWSGNTFTETLIKKGILVVEGNRVLLNGKDIRSILGNKLSIGEVREIAKRIRENRFVNRLHDVCVMWTYHGRR